MDGAGLSKDATRSVAPVGWTGRFWAARDALVSSPKFQRWAATFPLTRCIARSQAQATFDLCAGFVYSQVLFSCVELRLLEILAEGPQPVAGLAARVGLPLRAMETLLAAAAALGLVSRRRHQQWGLGMRGAALMGNPSVAQMVRHHAMLYADLADPVGLLRGQAEATRLARYWPYAIAENPTKLDDSAVGPYSALMAASQAMIADDILDAYPLGAHKKLLDVGGGEGAFLGVAGLRAPHLQLGLFDLPAVTERAKARLETRGLGGRTTLFGGNFFTDPLPREFDLVSLVRIAHDHDDAPLMTLFRAIRAALPRGGVLLLAEPMSGTSGAEAVADAYFGFYLLAMGSGRPRTADTLCKFMREAGFSEARRVATARPMLTSLVRATA
jgi:demethylspheroidene O-methyltransferase